MGIPGYLNIMPVIIEMKTQDIIPYYLLNNEAHF
jgi:hypothetical protein